MTARGVDAVVIAGIGSEYRHDDAIGAIVGEQAARRSGARWAGPLVDPLDLLGHWDDAALAVVVDAVRSGAEPGTVTVMDLAPSGRADGTRGPRRPGPVPRRPGTARATSSHGVDVLGVHRLARAVGHAPARVVVVGVEGEDFSLGSGLSPRVEAAVPEALRAVLALVEEAASCA